MKIIVSVSKIKNIGISFIIGILLLSSCSEQDKKAKLEGLKIQLEELNKQIETLENEIEKEGGDSGMVKINLVKVEKVKAQIFSTYIDVQGRVDADENVVLSTEIPGTINKINIKVGDEVYKGQVLAETDNRAIVQSISDLQTNLDLVVQLFEKQKSLWDQKIGTEIQYLQAKTNKESLEKKLASLQEQLRMSKIISPIDGTIDAVNVKIGEAVAPGMPAIRVINFSNLKVKAELSESYANRVHKNDPVRIYFPDINDSADSKINYASRAINPMSRTFTAEMLLDGKKQYHPNMVTKIKINDYTSPTPIIVVPVRVIQNSSSGARYVYVADGNVAQLKEIKTGREYNGMIEVIDGLVEDDKLIVLGFEAINNGDLITYTK